MSNEGPDEGSATKDLQSTPEVEPLKWTELLTEDNLEYLDESPSQIEWSRQKREENQQNIHLDRIMSMVGHEEVKSYFLSVKEKVTTLKRWNKNLSDWNFDLILEGRDGTGKRRIAQVYAEFLHSIGVVQDRNFVLEQNCSELAGGYKGTIVFVADASWIIAHPAFDRILRESCAVLILSFRSLHPAKKDRLSSEGESRRRLSNHLVLKDYQQSEIKDLLKQLCIVQGISGDLEILFDILARKIDRQRITEKGKFKNAHTVEEELKWVVERKEKRLRQAQRQMDEEWLAWAGKTCPGEDFPLEENKDELILEDVLGPKPGSYRESSTWKDIQSLVGLKQVKEDLGFVLDMVEFNLEQIRYGCQPMSMSLNRCFIGPPGVGKTTVAALYAKMIDELELLPGKIVTRRASDLLDPAISGSEEKMTQALSEAERGILIIDDAHLLYQETPNGSVESDPTRTGVIDTLVANLSGHPGEKRCVILCGYTGRLERMILKSNPGMQRRFPLEHSIQFENYNDQELVHILKQKMERDDLTATEEAFQVARDLLSKRRRKPNFGNGGDVETILSQAKIRRIKRLRNSTISFLDFHSQPLEPEDFDPEIDRSAKADLHRNALFQDFVGFESITNKFKGYKKMADGMRRCGIDPKPYIPWAFIFKGPPGTGKTTTAKKVGKLFYDMGVLSSDEVVTCSVTSLIGQYTGHTGPKVISQFERGLGKVLFIDEAYRLAENTFHKDAVGEIVDTMTNPQYARNMVVILAGYGNEMEKLLSTNPGLRSRFPTVIDFPHMSPKDCLLLLSRLLAKINIRISSSITENMVVLDVLTRLTDTEGWASGRDVETLSQMVAEYVFVNMEEESELMAGLDGLMVCLNAMLEEKESIKPLDFELIYTYKVL
ncbi:nfx1-type zinc finger-containing 1 [Fusarium longipes]|uniref:Nfx1-type zinc finger-containing 1 n=1 Tax=Fusarium longipes TaxID=694270 RepID=A0A395SHZ0_9HYPO|nr:nfx1-type zinc finger-containing 1 [Fusarium longipes]